MELAAERADMGTLEDLKNAVFGTGGNDDGLKGRVRQVERTLKELMDEREEEREERKAIRADARRALFAIVTAIILGALGLLWTAFEVKSTIVEGVISVKQSNAATRNALEADDR